MHTVALQLAPILAAEKSKVPFYIAGGLLVAWALIVSLGLGLRKPDFPGSLRGQRTVSAITGVLVLGAVSTAVLTSGTPTKSATTTTPIYAEPSAPFPSVAQASPASATAASTPAATSTTTSTPAATSTTTSKTTAAAPPSAGVTSKLSLAADPSGLLKYNTTQLQAKAGTVTINMANMSPVEHNVTVASGTTVLGATPTFSGGTRSLTLKLKPGRYTFYCSVPGHRQAGMEGTITVS